ncbi:ribosome-associated factor Y [Borreliella garinii]|uniref:HPF/RaiA family ribosome-associated protein n=1 Tax=Borreliella garinii TaxID=29519 RepID=UPI00041B4C3E|nr:HPF/RaiA family ribosome-associated protein [Borreliella garinii]APQ15127.1 ribosome-associated factor Y [Borreliella garinii]AZA27868.1 ribosome-associated factor Y [Borreliella garinii]KEO62405.1 ribosome-associated factor Y [Borreliella garinii]
MEPKIQTVNYNLNESEKNFILKKLEKFDTHIKKHVENLKITIKKEHELLEFDAHVHFNWGKIIHIREDDKVFLNLIDRAIEKLYKTAIKEKEKKNNK